jgi:serine/threonine protein kinase
MVSTELGACEWFVWDLRRSNLIDRGQLDQVIGEFLSKNPRAEPAALSEFLVQQGILTQFQADRLLQGKTQGFVLGPFTLMDALGAGSMGTVYKATSKTDNKWYAVKVLPRRSMWNVRIARRKVRAFEQCRHPAVVPFVDVGTAGGMHYLAWPYVEGESFDRIVQHQGRLKPSLVAYYALQIAEGLEICHQQGLFHGFLKASNLLINADNQVHILDFGIGCLLAETEGESLVDTMSTANSVASGLDCASPESIMDPTKLTPAGDQYSLGCVLYYALTGQYPFPTGSAADKMMAHQFKQPQAIHELNPDVPPAMVTIIERLMKKKPEDRFGSVAELIEELKPLAGSSPPPEARPAAAPRTAPRDLSPPTPPPSNRPPSVSGRPRPPSGRSSSSPSEPTPRPPSNSLPTRNTIRGANGAAPAAPAAPPVPGPAPKPATKPPSKPGTKPGPAIADHAKPNQGREVPGNITAGFSDPDEDQLGPLGITFGAIAACALVWLVAVWLRLF